MCGWRSSLEPLWQPIARKAGLLRRRMECAESTLIGHDARPLTRAQEKKRLRSARGGVICTSHALF
jgi:hypothetical protein